MDDKAFADLDTLDLKLEGLQIWVHGRQFPDLHDYWDGNWLRVTAHCGGSGASIGAAAEDVLGAAARIPVSGMKR